MSNATASVHRLNDAGMTFQERVKDDFGWQIKTMRKSKSYYLFMLPFFLIFTVFTVLPVVLSIILSFTSFNMLQPPKFIGFDNYYRMFFEDSIFMTKSLKNTLEFALITGPVGYLLAFMFGWMINELRHGLRVFFTIVFYAPSISGGMNIMWTNVFAGDSQGYANSFGLNLGLINSPILWFNDEKYMRTLIIVIVLWMSLGTTFLIFIAGFQGLDRQYFEAAAIDGVNNRWQELWYITLPMMKPQLVLNAVLTITGSFSIGDIVTAFCGFPSTNYAAHTIMNELADYGGIRYEMGYASAIATVLFLMMVGTNLLFNKMLRGVGA